MVLASGTHSALSTSALKAQGFQYNSGLELRTPFSRSKRRFQQLTFPHCYMCGSFFMGESRSNRCDSTLMNVYDPYVKLADRWAPRLRGPDREEQKTKTF